MLDSLKPFLKQEFNAIDYASSVLSGEEDIPTALVRLSMGIDSLKKELSEQVM